MGFGKIFLRIKEALGAGGRKDRRFLTVFFDVDGVLNNEGDWHTPFRLNEGCIHSFGELNRRLREEGFLPSYVICSTWRAGKDLWGNEHVGQYEYLLERLRAEGITVADATPITDKGRQAEVEYFIRKNHIYRYIVIDDDIYLYLEPEKLNIFVTDYRIGLVETDIKKIMKMV